MTLLPALVASLALLVPGGADPVTQPAVHEQRRGPAAVSFAVDRVEGGRVEIRLSRTLEIRLVVEGGAGLEVESPARLTGSPGWRVLPPAPARRVDAGDGRVRWEQTFAVEPRPPLKAGGEVRHADLDLRLAPLRYRDGAGGTPWGEAAWEPIPVRVTTEVARATLDELRDFTGPEEVPGEPGGVAWGWWLAGGLTLAALTAAALALLGRLRRRPRAHAAALPPAHVWARLELRLLEEDGLAARGEFETFFTRLSDVLRGYLERRFALPASRRTTPEFLTALRDDARLGPESQAVLRDVLEACDRVKFARATVTGEDCRKAAALAESFIAATAGDRAAA